MGEPRGKKARRGGGGRAKIAARRRTMLLCFAASICCSAGCLMEASGLCVAVRMEETSMAAGKFTASACEPDKSEEVVRRGWKGRVGL